MSNMLLKTTKCNSFEVDLLEYVISLNIVIQHSCQFFCFVIKRKVTMSEERIVLGTRVLPYSSL